MNHKDLDEIMLMTIGNCGDITIPVSGTMSNGTYSNITNTFGSTMPSWLSSTPGTYATPSAVRTGFSIQDGIFSLNYDGKELVRLTENGKVEWAEDMEIDNAAKAFSTSLHIGHELAAGITQRVKLNMRDSVFEDLIDIAKEKGSLTADDLTYLLQASKIVEKLKS